MSRYECNAKKWVTLKGMDEIAGNEEIISLLKEHYPYHEIDMDRIQSAKTVVSGGSHRWRMVTLIYSRQTKGDDEGPED